MKGLLWIGLGQLLGGTATNRLAAEHIAFEFAGGRLGKE